MAQQPDYGVDSNEKQMKRAGEDERFDRDPLYSAMRPRKSYVREGDAAHQRMNTFAQAAMQGRREKKRTLGKSR